MDSKEVGIFLILIRIKLINDFAGDNIDLIIGNNIFIYTLNTLIIDKFQM